MDSEQPWETCQITYRVVKDRATFKSTICKFQAIATHPDGRTYEAIEQVQFSGELSAFETFSWRTQKAIRNTYHQFVDSLVQQGWEPMNPPTGDSWWAQTFRRVVEPEQEQGEVEEEGQEQEQEQGEVEEEEQARQGTSDLDVGLQTGICLMCGGVEVFTNAYRRRTSGLVGASHETVQLDNYVCTDCGYVELYLREEGVMQRIKESDLWDKVPVKNYESHRR